MKIHKYQTLFSLAETEISITYKREKVLDVDYTEKEHYAVLGCWEKSKSYQIITDPCSEDIFSPHV